MQSVGECSQTIQEGVKLTCVAGMSRGAATIELRQDQGSIGSQMGQQQQQHAAMMAQHHAAHAHAVQQMMQQQQQQQQHQQQHQQQQQQQQQQHQQQQRETHAPHGPQQQQPMPINLGGILQQVGSMANQFLGPILQQQSHPPPHAASSPESSAGPQQMQQLLQLQENMLREQQQLQQQQLLLQQQFSTILPLVASPSPSPSLPPPPPPTNNLHACLMATWRSLYALPQLFLYSTLASVPPQSSSRSPLPSPFFRSSVERDEFVSHGKVTSMAMGILAQYVALPLQYNNVTLKHVRARTAAVRGCDDDA